MIATAVAVRNRAEMGIPGAAAAPRSSSTRTTDIVLSGIRCSMVSDAVEVYVESTLSQKPTKFRVRPVEFPPLRLGAFPG